MREQKLLIWLAVVVLALGLAGCVRQLPGGEPNTPLVAPPQATLPGALPGEEQASTTPTPAGQIHLPAVSGGGAEGEAGGQEAGEGGMQIYFPVVPADVPAPTPVDVPQPVPAVETGDGEVDPHVELAVSSTELQVGQTVTLVATPVDIGLPYYYLYAQDDGSAVPVELARVTDNNEVRQSESASAILRLVQANGATDSGTFVLEAVAPGVTVIWVSATGEVHYPEGAVWSGGSSESIRITVSN